ncbi:hypothetical protein HPB47_004764, partial [Ixodes persulcatus]
ALLIGSAEARAARTQRERRTLARAAVKRGRATCPEINGAKNVSRGPSSNNDDPFHLLMDRNERHEPSESIQFRVSVWLVGSGVVHLKVKGRRGVPILIRATSTSGIRINFCRRPVKGCSNRTLQNARLRQIVKIEADASRFNFHDFVLFGHPLTRTVYGTAVVNTVRRALCPADVIAACRRPAAAAVGLEATPRELSLPTPPPPDPTGSIRGIAQAPNRELGAGVPKPPSPVRPKPCSLDESYVHLSPRDARCRKCTHLQVLPPRPLYPAPGTCVLLLDLKLCSHQRRAPAVSPSTC